jgi:hypothetical protein
MSRSRFKIILNHALNRDRDRRVHEGPQKNDHQ